MNPINIIRNPMNLKIVVLESLLESTLSNNVIIFVGYGSIRSTTSGIIELNMESTHVAQGQQAQRMHTVSLSGELSSPSGTATLYGFHFLNVNDPVDGPVFSSSIA